MLFLQSFLRSKYLQRFLGGGAGSFGICKRGNFLLILISKIYVKHLYIDYLITFCFYIDSAREFVKIFLDS